jgi:hypothetical protein
VSVADPAVAGTDRGRDAPHPFPEGARGTLVRARGLVSPIWMTAWYASPWASARRRTRFEGHGLPAPPNSLAVLAGVATDELARAVFTIVRRMPSPEALDRIEAEVDDAIVQFDRAGWLGDPRAYHEELAAPEMLVERTWVDVARLECLRWSSGWAPHPGEAGGARWEALEENRHARAYVLRHQDGPRPWLVCVHATEMGRPEIDRRLFRAAHLHRQFGLNVVMPVLPLHGSRRAARGTGVEFPTIDVLDNVHGLAQAAADVRSVLGWVRAQEPTGIGLLGVSLGGGVAALVAALEPPLDCVIAGLPVVDFPDLFRRNSPPEVRHLPRYQTLATNAAVLHQVVSPLLAVPATPVDRRFVFAGLADRLVDPVRHAHALAEHWGGPTVHWYEGGHVGHLLDRGIARFVDGALIQSGLVAPPATDGGDAAP